MTADPRWDRTANDAMPPSVETSDPLLRRISRTVHRHGMLSEGDHILVGVSGGPDSVALLHALVALSPAWNLKLIVGHMNHGLRREADQEEAFVRRLSARFGLAFHHDLATQASFKAAAGRGPEAAARHVRFRFFRQVAASEGVNRVALGHHADDNAELVLMRLIRGSGPLGLAGIPPVRTLDKGPPPVWVIRPLLEIRRKTILDYLERVGANAVTDASNIDPRFLRNRIRHRLLPLLEADYNSGIVPGLNRLSGILRAEEQWIESLADAEVAKRRLTCRGGDLELRTDGFAGLPPAFQRRFLRAAIRRVKGGLDRIGYAHIEAVRELLARKLPGGSVDLPDRLRVERFDRGLRIAVKPLPLRKTPATMALVPDFEYRLAAPGEFRIPETGWTIRIQEVPPGRIPGESGQFQAFFDMKQVGFPIVIRNWRPGDRFSPSGMEGTQKVKKIFIDRKIPRAERKRFPLLVHQDDILWIAGLRRSRIGTPDHASQRLLHVELQLV
ncbi:MAG: tRNA lysidine(34) synthetase TilS [Desulfobacterales bacterium]